MGILDDSLILQLASDTNYAVQSDAYDATAIKVAPSLGVLKQGVRPARQFGAQHKNWIDREIALYLAALHTDDGAIRTEFAAADTAEANARAAADTALAAAITADVDDLDDLIDNGFAEGWPKLKAGNTVRTHVENQTFNFSDVAHGGAWTEGFGSPDTLGSMLGSGVNGFAFVPIRKLRNNATLTNVRVYLTVKNTHSGIPATRPAIAIVRKPFGAAASIEVVADTFPDPALYATFTAWNTPDVTGDVYIDVPASLLVSDGSSYWIRINDEHGSNAVSGNRYWGALLTWAITEVQP